MTGLLHYTGQGEFGGHDLHWGRRIQSSIGGLTTPEKKVEESLLRPNTGKSGNQSSVFKAL